MNAKRQRAEPTLKGMAYATLPASDAHGSGWVGGSLEYRGCPRIVAAKLDCVKKHGVCVCSFP